MSLYRYITRKSTFLFLAVPVLSMLSVGESVAADSDDLASDKIARVSSDLR